MTRHLPHNQRGIATLLILLFTALALTITTFSMLRSVRSSQDRVLSLHSSTQAQQQAWQGVELLRLYLETQNTAQLLALQGSAVEISGLSGLQINIKQVQQQADGSYKVQAEINGSTVENTHAESHSLIEAVYRVGTSGGSSGGTALSEGITIYSNLNLSGKIEVTGGNGVQLNVMGNVTLSGTVKGIDTINAMGSVTINSAITVNTIRANGDVTLSGSASIISLTTKGNVELSGAAKIGTVHAEGTVKLSGGSASVEVIKAIGDVIIGGNAKATTIDTQGYVDWKSTNSASIINANSYVIYNGGSPAIINSGSNITLGGAGANTVIANGNVSITYGNINKVEANGNLSATNGNVSSGIIRGTKSCPSWNPCSGVNENPSFEASPIEVSVEPVATITIQSQRIDANELRDTANYIFEIDAEGYRRVTVSQINGIEDGTYYIGNYNGPYKDYLCHQVSGSTSSPTCIEPAIPNKTICKGQSSYNPCISYINGQWLLDGTIPTLAPGILWFKGNLQVGNGTYYNSIIATGNITTSGSTIIWATNYAGYDKVCNTAPFTELYPSNLCDKTTQSLVSNPVGNLALLAGSYSNNQFIGGDITLGSSNQVYGSVIAGSLLSTGGSTTIHGYITVAAQRLGDAPTANWGASTKIDLTNLPTHFDPTTPCLLEKCGSSSGVQLKWTRYR